MTRTRASVGGRLGIVTLLSIVALTLVPAALADTVTLYPEADTFVRQGDAAGHGTDTFIDVFGGVSSYGCGSGPTKGLLRFALSTIPAGATITSATLRLTSTTGFAFDGDPFHRALFIADDLWDENATVWPGPADGVQPFSPPTEWQLGGFPLSTSPDLLGSANAFSAVGCAGSESVLRDFNTASSTNLASRIGSERAGDGKLSIGLLSIACGTTFTVSCQSSGTEKAYFLRYASKEASLLTQPRLEVTYTTATDLVVTNMGDSGPGSLRQAMTNANAQPGLDTITFAIPGGGGKTITPDTVLPAITDPVVIDGTTQPGFAGAPLIFINGTTAACGECGNGLTVRAGGAGSTIRGLAIGNFDGYGVLLDGGTVGSVVEGTWIGVNLTGSSYDGNGSGAIGILGSANNRIGGSLASQRVVTGANSRNFGPQITIVGPASTGNVVQGSYIGIGADGVDTFDGEHGIVIEDGAAGNTIGGDSAAGRGNAFAGLYGRGVIIDGAGTGNVVAGNAIGLDGTGARGEAPETGIYVLDTPGTVIGTNVNPSQLGSVDYDLGNVVVGSREGIWLDGTTSGTVITGNFVGTDRAGTATTLGNSTGIRITGAGNQIGPGNTVAFNTGAGVEVDGGTANGNRIVANSIHDNGGKGISLLTGANRALAEPSIDGATSGTVFGTVSGPPATTFFVELFRNASCAVGVEGRTYRSFVSVTTPAGTGTQTAAWSTPAVGLVEGDGVTATSTNSSTGDTSEFSACASVGAGGPPPIATVSLSLSPGSVTSTGRVPLANVPGSAFVARPAGATESTPIKDVPIKDVPIKDVPIKDVPIKDVPIKDVGFESGSILGLLQQFPLSEVPLLRTGGWPAALAGTAFATAPLQNVSLGDALALPTVQALNLKLVDLDFSRSPLGDAPAIAFVLGTVPLALLPLPSGDWCSALAGPPTSCSASNPLPSGSSVLSVTIQGAPIKDVALTQIPIKDVPIKDVPIKDVPIKDVPIKDVPIKDVALAAIPIKDVANYAAVVDCGRVNCLTGTLYDAFVAQPTPAFPASTTVEVLVEALPDPNDATLGDLLVLLFSGTASVGWEGLNLETAGLQLAAGGANAVTARATVALAPAAGGSPGAPATVPVTITLPKGFLWDDRTDPTAVQTVPAGPTVTLDAPDVGEDALGRPTLEWTLNGVVGRTYRIDFKVFPALRLGPADSTAAAEPTGGVKATSAPEPVSVTESFSGNDDEASATIVDTESLYVSYVTNADDLDYFRIPNPAAGSRITVYLSHLAADYDLVLYGPTEVNARTLDGAPIDGNVLTDEGVPLTNETQALPSQALDDLRVIATKPLAGISATRGRDDETVSTIATSGGPSDYYLVQVTPYNGASSSEPYVIRVEITPPAQPLDAAPLAVRTPIPAAAPVLPTGTKALFLVNRGALDAEYGAGSASAVVGAITSAQSALTANGYPSAIVTLDGYDGQNGTPNVAGAMAAFAADPGSAAKANGAVAAINAVVDGLRGQANGTGIRYLVLVGGDRIIPFGRLSDFTTISNEQDYAATLGSGELFAAAGAGYMLSDDPYGDTTPSRYLDRALYVPDLAVGRLVETPAEIQGTLGRYAAFAGRLSPTATVTGYDFLTDGARAVATELGAPTTSPLLGDTWTRADLEGALANATDSVSINAHADHTRFQPPAPSSAISRPAPFTTAELGTMSLTNRLLFSMGCHSGLSVADAMIASNLDWPQALGRAGSGAYAGNTTFGYGDTLEVAYSEELNRLFAKFLKQGLNVGDAFRFAKNEYFSTRGVFGVYDEKAMAGFTLYGLPMWDLQAPFGPSAASLAPSGPTPLAVEESASIAAIPATTAGSDTIVGLPVLQFDASPANTEVQPQPTQGRLWRGDSGFQISHLRPVQPKLVVPLPGVDARNTLITGLTSQDFGGINPYYARPIVDSAATEPELPFDDVAFPSTLPSVRTFLSPTGTKQTLVLVTGQFFGNPTTTDTAGTGTQRLYSRIAGQVYRSTAADVTPPAFTRIDARLVSGFAAFSVDVGDNAAAGIKRVLVLYRSGTGGGPSAWKTLDLARDTAVGAWSGAGPNDDLLRFEYFVQAVDAAGNVAVSTNKGFYFDGERLPDTPPPPAGVGDVVLDPGTPTGTNGFFTGPVPVAVQAPPGVTVRVSVDGGPPTVRSGSFTLTGDGVHLLEAEGSNGDTDTKVVAIDTTPPQVVFTVPTPGATYPAMSVQKADYTCVDPGSGVAAVGGCAGQVAVGASIPTLPAGSRTFTVDVKDRAGNTATRTVTYNVSPFAFSGFFSPVDNPPTFNVANAGSAIPVKFSIGGNFGLGILAPGSPVVTTISCSTTAALDTIESTVAASSSGLQYDPSSGQYTYVWKTTKGWTGCRQLDVKLVDGESHVARIRFK